MNTFIVRWPEITPALNTSHNTVLTQKAQQSSVFFTLFCFVTYFGDVLWRLSHGFKYIYRRWQINVFKISNRVRIGPWVFHLGYILHHFGLELRVYGPRLNHGQPVEGAHAKKGGEGAEKVSSCYKWTKESQQSTGH